MSDFTVRGGQNMSDKFFDFNGDGKEDYLAWLFLMAVWNTVK